MMPIPVFTLIGWALSFTGLKDTAIKWLAPFVSYGLIAVAVLLGGLWIQRSNDDVVRARVLAIEVKKQAALQATIDAMDIEAKRVERDQAIAQADRFKRQAEADRAAADAEAAQARAMADEALAAATERQKRFAAAKADADAARKEADALEAQLRTQITTKDAANDTIQKLRAALARAQQPQNCAAGPVDVARSRRLLGIP